MSIASSLPTTALPAVPAVPPHRPLRAALGLAVATLLVFGLAYCLAGVGLGQLLFRSSATGSLIEAQGRVLGSALVAQPFAGDGWFHPRPSAAGYDLTRLAGSNQARTNPELRERLARERAAIAAREGVAPGTVPAELPAQSGSGIDPHISPQGAAIQVARVARVRGLAPEVVVRLVEQATELPQYGLLGQPRVNVLRLNLALKALAP